MSNPYSSRQKETKETPIEMGVSDYMLLIIVIFLMTYGLTSLLEDYKFIDRKWEHFWFEEDLRRWIHGK